MLTDYHQKTLLFSFKPISEVKQGQTEKYMKKILIK